MKSVFKLSVFSLFCAGISLVVLASEDYRETILKEAALRSGYLLPAEINQPFDPKKSALGKVFLGDPLPRRTAIAQIFSLVSAVVVYIPSLTAALDPKPNREERLALEPIDLVPLVTGVAVATLAW